MFKEYDRGTSYLLPPSIEDWLPSNHPARFIVEIIERLDIHTIINSYSPRGEKGYHPEVLLGLLVLRLCDRNILKPQDRRKEL